MALKTILFLAALLSCRSSYAAKKTSFDYVFTQASYTWWQEELTMTTPTGIKHDLLAHVHGPCVGFGYLHRRVTWDITFSGCGFFGRADVSNTTSQTGTPQEYAKRGIQTIAVFGGPGLYYRPSSRQVGIGIMVPAFARSTQWPALIDGWAIEPSLRISGGVLADAYWRIDRVVVRQKAGPLFNVGYGWFWSLGVEYIF
jgi:hypothetical protein